MRLGHEVTVFTRAKYDQHASGDFHGVKLRKLPAIYTKHLEAISNTILAVLCALRGFDIVHINATGPALLAFLPRLFGRKVIVTVHGLDWKREKWGAFAKFWLRLGARAAVLFPNRTVVVSQTLGEHYRKHYGNKVVYIPNGVALPDIGTLAHVKNPLDLVKGSYVLFLSRLVPEKGCHTLISAFKRLKTDKTLVVAGPSTHSEDYASSLRRLAKGDQRIIFAGAQYGPQKDALFRDAFLFVLPSTIEGMAIVLLEAMSFGCGCLCSDIPENLEVVASKSNNGSEDGGDRAEVSYATPESDIAATFRAEDIDDLHRQLEALLNQPELVLQLGLNARTHVSRRFNWDSIVKQYVQTYRDSLGEPK